MIVEVGVAVEVGIALEVAAEAAGSVRVGVEVSLGLDKVEGSIVVGTVAVVQLKPANITKKLIAKPPIFVEREEQFLINIPVSLQSASTLCDTS
jgi:hypothetical protein